MEIAAVCCKEELGSGRGKKWSLAAETCVWRRGTTAAQQGTESKKNEQHW